MQMTMVLALLCAWGVPIDVYVAAALGGVNMTKPGVTPLEAGRIFLRVCSFRPKTLGVNGS